MDSVRRVSIPSKMYWPEHLHLVSKVFEQLKARYATDIKRANEAESRLHEMQEINEERRKQAQDLQTRLDLARQHNTLMKQLLVVLPKLEEAKNK